MYPYTTMPTGTQPFGYPYNPYNPYFMQQQQMQQQSQQNTQQQAQQPMQQQMQQPVNTNKVFVTGIEDVRTRMLPPSSEYIFFDNDKDLMYEKKTNAMGQFDVKVYDISIHEDKKEEKKEEAPVGYVSQETFNELQDNLNILKSEMKVLKDRFEKLYATTPTTTVSTVKKENVTNG